MIRRSPPVFRVIMLLLIFMATLLIMVVILTDMKLVFKDGQFSFQSSLSAGAKANPHVKGLNAENWLLLADRYSKAGIFPACEDALNNYFLLSSEEDYAKLYYQLALNFLGCEKYKESLVYLTRAREAGFEDREEIEKTINLAEKKAGISRNRIEEKTLIARFADVEVFANELGDEIKFRKLNEMNLSEEEKKSLIEIIARRKYIFKKAVKLGLDSDKRIGKDASIVKLYYLISIFLEVKDQNTELSVLANHLLDIGMIDDRIKNILSKQVDLKVEYIDD